MKQLISRIHDDLHRRLKWRAAREGRSLNDYVTEVLEQAVSDDAAGLRRRLARSGLRVVPPGRPEAPSLEEVLRANRGTGTPLSDALRVERADR